VAAKWTTPERVCRGEPVGHSQTTLLDTPKKQEQAWRLRGDMRPKVSDLVIRYPNGVELQLPSQTPVAQLRNLIFL